MTYNISEIVQGIVTIAVVGTICYLAATGQPIPGILTTILSLVIGFYFGARSERIILNRRDNRAS